MLVGQTEKRWVIWKRYTHDKSKRDLLSLGLLIMIWRTFITNNNISGLHSCSSVPVLRAFSSSFHVLVISIRQVLEVKPKLLCLLFFIPLNCSALVQPVRVFWWYSTRSPSGHGESQKADLCSETVFIQFFLHKRERVFLLFIFFFQNKSLRGTNRSKLTRTMHTSSSTRDY